MIFLQVAISDLHKQTLAEHRLSIEPTDAGVASNVATSQSDELRRRRRLTRWRKEKRQLDFIKVLCHPAIKEIDVSQEVRPNIFFGHKHIYRNFIHRILRWSPKLMRFQAICIHNDRMLLLEMINIPIKTKPNLTYALAAGERAN